MPPRLNRSLGSKRITGLRSAVNASIASLVEARVDNEPAELGTMSARIGGLEQNFNRLIAYQREVLREDTSEDLPDGTRQTGTTPRADLSPTGRGELNLR
ncbi:hypothetical protein ACQR1I_04185 [Bradyrhizobium sp. HKCCYLS2038]|uniref:hypothetical protein n=1 Tax=unclassified Bradyrhizobium TaxID=2631580 RepID=UPI003EB69D33